MQAICLSFNINLVSRPASDGGRRPARWLALQRKGTMWRYACVQSIRDRVIIVCSRAPVGPIGQNRYRVVREPIGYTSGRGRVDRILIGKKKKSPLLDFFTIAARPGRVAQSVGHLTRKSGVLGSIPGLATYFRFSFRFIKKGSCQLLAKVCA